jgi:ATP-dependent Clp protease ATP-binding subunit ClpA
MPTHSQYSHHARRSARLSELSRRVISAAQQMAASFHHPTVGLGHLLLALLSETRSPVSVLLLESGLNETRLRNGLIKADPRLLISAENVLSQALNKMSGSHYTGTEHLLLALVLDGEGSALLVAYGIQLDDLYRRLNPESD